MKSDEEIFEDVSAELAWDSRLNDASIATTVNDGDVELTGTVSSYPKKINAGRAVQRVMGVKSVTNNLAVVIPEEQRRSDNAIERSVTNAVTWNSSIDENKIYVTVKNGHVTLEGTVAWEYQRSKARLLAEDISGVVSVTNLITVEPIIPTTAEVHKKIAAAFRRNYYLDPDKIHIAIEDTKVILRGYVRSLLEKKCAEKAAWSAPGITDVDNNLDVNYSEILV